MNSDNITSYYGVINMLYFMLFMYRYRQGQIEIGPSAAVNIVVLFMVLQPISRIIGALNGLVLFGTSCMSSIVLLPSPADERRKQIHAEELEERNRLKTRSKKKKEKLN